MNNKIENIIVSISILVSNRIDTIRKCLESIRPILEQLPAELIIIDTKGENSDGSVDVAREYTDKIYPFTWCNDFSAARNEGLKRSTGEWFMFLDDDEWFEDVADILRFFKSGEYKKYKCATYQIHDYRDNKGSYSVGRLNRMIKREANTRFCGKVHEYLTPLYLPCKDLNSFIHHHGYAFDSDEARKKHCERNLSLLIPEFEQRPEDLRLRLQLVQEYMALEEYYPKAEVLCEEAFVLEKSCHDAAAFQWLLTAYVKLAEKKNDAGLMAERIARVRGLALPKSFAVIGLAIMEIRALSELGINEERKATILACLQEIEVAREYLLQHPEKQTMQRILDFDVLLEPAVAAEAWKDGIIACLETGDKENAVVWTKKRQVLLQAPAVSVSLLVSNNIATIRKCLESLRPLLQAVPSELVVVDTVGEENSDGSLAVAKEYTDHIVRFVWCDDFAAARNAGLKEASGEWFLFLDDDEWFEDISEITEFFRTGEYLRYNSGTYRIRNYQDKEGQKYSVAELGRMIKRNNSTCFEGKIHEAFREMFLPCKSFGAYVHHFGYVYDSEEERQRHQQRNIALLQEELAKDNTNLKYRTQLALEYATFDNERALRICEETFSLCAEQSARPEFQWQLALVFRLYEALGVDADAAEQTYRELEGAFGYSETAKLAISYQLIRIFIIQKNYVKAYSFVVQYIELLQYLQEHPEEQQLQMAADFARYQTGESYLEIMQFGGYVAWQIKAYEDAWFFFTELPWEQEGYQYTDGLWFVINLYAEMPDAQALYQIIQRVMKNGAMKAELAVMMQNPVVKQRISEALEAMKNRS